MEADMTGLKMALGAVLVVLVVAVLCVLGAVLSTPDDEWHGMDDDWGKGE